MLVSVAAVDPWRPPSLPSPAADYQAPSERLKTRGWRRVGTAVVRWPEANSGHVGRLPWWDILGYRPGCNDRYRLRAGTLSTAGMRPLDRHFWPQRMNPEMLLFESDRGMRNPAGMLVIGKIAKEVLHVSGVERVQAITGRRGCPLSMRRFPFRSA